MSIEKHRRKLTNGEEKIYTYEVTPEGDYKQLSVRDSSVSSPLYRKQEKKRIVASLLAASSLLVIGEAGCGKSFLAEAVAVELVDAGFTVAKTKSGTVKQVFLHLAAQLGVDSESIEGKSLKTEELADAIADWLLENTAFIICDNAHRMPVSLRCWLERLHELHQPMLLLATFPPAKDIFLKIPRIELNPLKDKEIREIMLAESSALAMEISPGKLAELQQRVGGNPMLARRVVREEYLGLEGKNADHTQWVDGTPFLIAGLTCLVIIRFLGLGFNSTSLYLFGGIITVAIGVIRIMIYSLPRKSGRLGK